MTKVLEQRGVASEVREQRLVTEWEDIVGERVAVRAWPDGLRQGVLFIRVSNSAWLHELSFLKEAILASANRMAGPPTLVKEVRLHLGPRRGAAADDVVAELAAARRRPRAAPTPRPALSAAGESAMTRATDRVAHIELRLAIREAWRKLGDNKS